MSTLVNIVHPYVYKMEDGENIIGPSDYFRERDEKVAAFLRAALDEAFVLHQRQYPEHSPEGMLETAAFEMDPAYRGIFIDKRMMAAVTPLTGIPLPDTRVERISETEWERLSKMFTDHSTLRSLVG